MGFVATEQVEALDYDFRPHVERHGTIPEPSTSQIERFRQGIVDIFASTGIDPESLTTGKVDLAHMGELMDQMSEVEAATVTAVADLTGIADRDINALPYRIKAAFVGWIMGQFFSPEA